jgi:hypothetical protein
LHMEGENLIANVIAFLKLLKPKGSG